MNPEYIKFSREEVVYGQKSLLGSQLETINIIQRSRRYQELRNTELTLKILLKTKIDEACQSLEVLEKILPKPTMGESKQPFSEIKINKERLTLSDEIDTIRRKLAKLQA